jgi:hypothetical protein
VFLAHFCLSVVNQHTATPKQKVSVFDELLLDLRREADGVCHVVGSLVDHALDFQSGVLH